MKLKTSIKTIVGLLIAFISVWIIIVKYKMAICKTKIYFGRSNLKTLLLSLNEIHKLKINKISVEYLTT